MKKIFFFDYKFFFIRVCQYLVYISNFIQSFFPNKKINLKGDEKILIIQTDRIGDGVWTNYVVETIKSNFENIKVDLICNDYNNFLFDEKKQLYKDIIILSQKPQEGILKNFYMIFSIFIDQFSIIKKYFSLINKLRSNKYDYILNFNGRNFFIFSKLIGKNVGNGLGVLNILYSYPIYFHNEIGSKLHIVDKRLNILNIENKHKNKINLINKFKKIILFKGGKLPNRLEFDNYDLIEIFFQNKGFEIDLMGDYQKGNKYIIRKDGDFFVDGISLRNFLKEYDLFVGVDGGVIHYCSQFINTIGIYTSTNPFVAHPYGGKIEFLTKLGNYSIFRTKDLNHFIISKNLKCVGCFQIGCFKKKCEDFDAINLNKILDYIIYKL